MAEQYGAGAAGEAPAVPQWKIWGLRAIFLGMAAILGTQQWTMLFGGTEDWSVASGLAHSLLAALSLVAWLGVLHPVKLLPVMLFEIGWKSVWLLGIALPAHLGARVTPEIAELFWECIGIIIAPLFVPWRYVWWRYVAQPPEPWRAARQPVATPSR